jgi:hypothetical protein
MYKIDRMENVNCVNRQKVNGSIGDLKSTVNRLARLMGTEPCAERPASARTKSF